MFPGYVILAESEGVERLGMAASCMRSHSTHKSYGFIGFRLRFEICFMAVILKRVLFLLILFSFQRELSVLMLIYVGV